MFGTTVFGYLLERKIVQARDMLLEEKDKTIAEVSEQCSYQYASHFTAAFKRRCGVPPSQLKRRSF
ncbi:MAG: helix-turn-helix domain-containing protein [Bacteroidota bacterium]